MNISDKNILIIGANGGLATETIKHLINDGATKITLGCRTKSKANLTKEHLENSMKGHVNCELIPIGGFDMHDQSAIENTIRNIESNGYDVIFLAAGGAIFTTSFQTINSGNHSIEKTSYQNLFGAHITLKALHKYNLINKNARVVIAGGEGARGIPRMISKPNFNSSLELRNYLYAKTKQSYNTMDSIGVSKLMGALWTLKLHQKKVPFEILWFSPGLTYGTKGLGGMSPTKRWFMQHIGFGIMRAFGKAQSPSDGGRKNADCLNGSIGISGDVLGAPDKQTLGKITDQKPMNSNITNKELQEELWSILENVTGPFEITETITY